MENKKNMGLGNFLCYKTTKGLFIAYICRSGLAITGSNFVKKGAKLEVEFCENVSKKEGGTLKFCNKEKSESSFRVSLQSHSQTEVANLSC